MNGAKHSSGRVRGEAFLRLSGPESPAWQSDFLLYFVEAMLSCSIPALGLLSCLPACLSPVLCFLTLLLLTTPELVRRLFSREASHVGICAVFFARCCSRFSRSEFIFESVQGGRYDLTCRKVHPRCSPLCQLHSAPVTVPYDSSSKELRLHRF